MEMARYFEEGGPMMFLGILVFLGVLAAIVVQFVRAKRTNLIPFIVGGIAIQLLVGGYATVLGISRSFEALAMVDPSMQEAIMAAGIAESVNNLSLAFGLAILETIAGAIAAFRRVNAKPSNA
ncbi:MAG: hypothetical protein M0R80_13095 [Proteobacteria bacterium]|jgi:hypothetical protein|nr:hypothetical protein [Pseudomonadota bacterium]